jgi:hypothetical protein
LWNEKKSVSIEKKNNSGENDDDKTVTGT